MDSKSVAIETMPMTLSRPEVVDIRDASAKGLELLRKRMEAQREMIKIAVGMTGAKQWCIFTDGNKESFYPTGGASDTILRRCFGLTWGDKNIELSAKGDSCYATATLYNGDQPIETFTGRRRMGGFVKNTDDLMRGAWENCKSSAVRDLLGLRGRTREEMKAFGLDVDKLESRAEFQTHDESDAPMISAVVPWGKKKGQPVTELDARDLDYYDGKAREAIADPAKAKWFAKEQRWLDAILAEK